MGLCLAFALLFVQEIPDAQTHHDDDATLQMCKRICNSGKSVLSCRTYQNHIMGGSVDSKCSLDHCRTEMFLQL